jgi:hypothetical protein
MKRFLLLLALPLFLAACGAEPVWAPDDVVSRARYVSDDGPSITLFTVVRNTVGEGAHSGILINASQAVLWDPAGTWEYPTAPERNDLHYGITPAMRVFYIDYHVRPAYDMIEQRVPVSPEIAEMVFRRAQNYGAVNKAFCGTSVSAILRDVPGFESIPQSFFPNRIMTAFGKLPGVTQTIHRDGDPDIVSGVKMVKPPRY